MNVYCAVACGVAVMMRTYQLWLLDNGIFPEVGAVFAPASKMQMAVRVVIELLVLLAAMRAPRMLSPRPIAVGTLACCALGVVLLVTVPHSAFAVTAGLMARLFGFCFGAYLIGTALSQVVDMRVVAISVSCAVLGATFIASFVPAPGFAASVVLDGVLTLATIALTWRWAQPVLAYIAGTPGASLRALANPRSFLAPSHQVFILIFFFSVAVGFGSLLRIDGLAPQASSLSIVALTCVLAGFLLIPDRRGHMREDALFVACALLVVAGFLVAPLEMLETGTANALLYAGRLAFGVVSWTVIAALCARNPAGSVMVVACGEIANAAGVLVGVELGDVCNTMIADAPQTASLMTSGAVLVLFAYTLVGLRSFSFAETIRGVEPAAPLPSPEPLAASRDRLFAVACGRLAVECGLTAREHEILGMLAQGHNGYHVRDKLGLSYNTVKTHVRRIYRKLDVHAQQELIDLVESKAAAEESA